MTRRIGSRYLERLSRLSHLLRHIDNGGFVEEPGVFRVKKRGYCCYDACPNKTRPSDRAVCVDYEGKRIEGYALHSECIGALMKDKRFQSLN